MDGSTGTGIMDSATDRADMPLENADDDDAASLEERVTRYRGGPCALFDALNE